MTFVSLVRSANLTTDIKRMVVRSGHVADDIDIGPICLYWKNGVQKKRRVELWKGYAQGRSASLSW